MPGPAVYVVAIVGACAVGIAFHQFVYEPHIAPKIEAWAENYVERRRQRRRQRNGPVLAQPTGGNDPRRSTDSSNDGRLGDDAGSRSIELEQLATTEREAWRDTSGLRHRNTTTALDTSDTVIAHPVMAPTHVLFDTDEPPSPGAHSIRTSASPSIENSPAHPLLGLQPATPRSPPRRPLSPRLPTPMSNYSSPSPRALTPSTLLSERSPLSSRRPTPDVGSSQAFTSAYNTPLGGSILSENGRDVPSHPSTSIQSPFSDIHSVDAHSSPEQVPTFRSPIVSPRVQSPSIGSDITLDSDDDFDVLSPRSGIFSPPNRVDDDLFDTASQHGSEMSWASVGRRSPVDF